MSRGGWRANAATGLALFTLLVVVLFGAALAWIDLPTLDYHPEQPAAETHGGDPREREDTKAQIWMAWAAWGQVFLSMLGLIGLGATVTFAALAWREAKRGADAAIDAANATAAQASTARDHLERMETPFLRAVPTPPPENNTGKPFNWVRDTTITLENCGRSYAIVTNWTADTVHSLKVAGRFDPLKDWGRYVGNALVVPAGGLSIPLRASSPHEINETYRLMEDQGGVVHGIVRYRDALGKRYVMGFAFTYTTHLRRFDQLVDPKSNYHYREDEMPYPPTGDA